MWSPGEQTTFQGAWDCLDKRAFVWFRRKAVVKEKTKTIKSTCRENVNTACWVAAHVVKKMYLSLGGIAGLVPSASCVSRQVTWGSGLQGALWGGGALSPSAQGSVDGGAPLAAGSWSHSISHSLSVNLSSASFPGQFCEECAFPGGLVVKRKDINSESPGKLFEPRFPHL